MGAKLLGLVTKRDADFVEATSRDVVRGSDRVVGEKFFSPWGKEVSFGLSPFPVIVTTRIVTFLVGNPYKHSFVTVTGWGVDRRYLGCPRKLGKG